MKQENLNLAHALAECIHVCNYCFSSCLEEEDVKMMKECIKLDKECAEICAATLATIYPGNHFTNEMLILCKKACLACAEECGKHSYEHCQTCARVCQACAKMCEEFRQA
ncbi:MAG: four-helix bundle copper-binding protein [Tannerellaceae bacterium]|nr:four-helix bundle copper-binding protein [Tannerellaceae bacterium]